MKILSKEKRRNFKAFRNFRYKNILKIENKRMSRNKTERRMIFLKLLVAECVEPKAELGDKRRQEQDE
jgi:hypothetical protein